MEGFLDAGYANSLREGERELRDLLQFMAHQNIKTHRHLWVPVTIAVPKAFGVYLIMIFGGQRTSLEAPPMNCPRSGALDWFADRLIHDW